MKGRGGKVTRTSSCQYLYTDGTLIEIFEEHRDGIHIGDTVDVTRGYCTLHIDRYLAQFHKEGVKCGRLVVSRNTNSDFIKLARGGVIRATLPSVMNGSENSRGRGLEVQYVELKTKSGIHLSWCEVVSVICGMVTIQGGSEYLIDEERMCVGFSWGHNARIWKITDLRPKAAVTPVAEVAAYETALSAVMAIRAPGLPREQLAFVSPEAREQIEFEAREKAGNAA